MKNKFDNRFVPFQAQHNYLWLSGNQNQRHCDEQRVGLCVGAKKQSQQSLELKDCFVSHSAKSAWFPRNDGLD